MFDRFELFIVLVTLFLGVPLGASLGWAQTYTTVDFPGATSTILRGINTAGDVVGSYTDTQQVIHGFILSGGVFTTIDVPNGSYQSATAINDSGDIVGSFFDAAANVTKGYLLSGGVFQTFQYGTATFTEFQGINNSGQITGFYAPAQVTHGFEGTFGKFTKVEPKGSVESSLSGINTKGVAVGLSVQSNVLAQGFMFYSGKFRKVAYPGANWTAADGINGTGQVVGYYEMGTSSTTPNIGFELQNGVYTTILYPGSYQTWANGINDAGTVVGYYEGFDPVNHGFIMTP